MWPRRGHIVQCCPVKGQHCSKIVATGAPLLTHSLSLSLSPFLFFALSLTRSTRSLTSAPPYFLSCVAINNMERRSGKRLFCEKEREGERKRFNTLMKILCCVRLTEWCLKLNERAAGAVEIKPPLRLAKCKYSGLFNSIALTLQY